MVIAKLKDGARLGVAVLTVLALLVGAAPAAARSLQDSLGQDILNTESATTTSQLAGGPFVTSTRAEPSGAFSPSFGSTASPEDDLATALDELSAAEGQDDPTVAAKSAITRALAILDGGGAPAVPADRAYSGMPLLNWNLADRVKDVHNGEDGDGNVDVRAVRFGDHTLLDTWLLRFDEPDEPFTITWHVTELGTSFGGQLAPATLLADGSTQIGQHALLKPLARAGVTTENAVSRFHPLGAPEESRLTTQTLKVNMPPARFVRAVLDPNLKPGHETFAQILPADDGALDRVAMAQQALGATKAEAISRLAPQAPETQIYTELGALLGAEGELVGDAATAAAKGTELRPLVGAMRSRDSLPAGVAGDPAADVSVVLMNDEAYISRKSVRVARDASLKISVTNLDRFDHRFKAVELKDRDPRLGADDWGAFRWSDLDGSVTVPGDGGTQTVTLTPANDAFTLWLGDPDLGDQTGMALKLDRGPLVQTLKLGEAGSLPLHQALDSAGRIWVTMEGADEIVRLDPDGGSLSGAVVERFPLPHGIKDPEHPPAAGQTEALLGPSDVAVDGQGIVWATLLTGNAIARIDPAAVEHGTTKGIKVLPLEACDRFCRKPPPPVVPGPLSREPLQMRVHEDGAGNTVIWFTEMMADRIGVVRVDSEGRKMDETHFTCGCTMPLGIALGGDGAVWFSEGQDNRLGRLTLDTTRPYASSTIDIKHFNIPSGIEEFTPGVPECRGAGCAVPNPVVTSLPHSVQIDPRGRVWFTEEATEKLGYLDPEQAKPGTTDGMHEVDGPVNDFKRRLAPADIAFDRAGAGYISDEYGDQVASAAVAENGAIQGRTAFRPAGRNSFTDAPMVDDAGNLWFIESGIDSITRVSGVTAGVPRPARSPLLTADTSGARLTAEGLREMTAVDLRVLRGATVVDQASDVAVSGGGFQVPLAMKAGDRVEITPKGDHAPRRFSFRVADLRASVGDDGSLGGVALLGGAPLPDRVSITVGATTDSAPIGAEHGDFSWGSGLSAATTGGTLSWTAGNVTARFRTVSDFGAEGGDVTPPPPSTGGGGTTAQPSTPATGSGAAKPATTPAQKKPAKRAVKPATCAAPRWLTRSAGRTTLPLLGLSASQAKACLGAPGRRAGERWTWPGKLELRFTRGRVSAFVLQHASMSSTPDRAGVGAPVPAFRRALGPLVTDGAGGRRGLVKLGTSRYAEVRLRVGRNGRVSRVTVTQRTRAGLDRVSRSLLKRAG